MATTSYEDQALLTHNATFRSRVKVSLITETNGIYGEDPGTANNVNRRAYADLVLTAPDSCVDRAMPILLTNGDVSGSAPDGVSIDDGTLQAVVGASWNALAKQAGFNA
jgi:hypothetical protein